MKIGFLVEFNNIVPLLQDIRDLYTLLRGKLLHITLTHPKLRGSVLTEDVPVIRLNLQKAFQHLLAIQVVHIYLTNQPHY